MPLLVAALTVLAAYFIGAIPFGYLIARWHGVNIFEQGSGNIGATNVGRTLGRHWGFLVFVLDFAKGAISVALALGLKTQYDIVLWTGGYVEVAAGLAAFLGHLFPIYLQFHGGKGVAAGCGVVLVLLPIPTACALFVWLVLLCATRYMSLASLAGVAVLIAVHPLAPPGWHWTQPRTWFCLIAGVLVIFKHRGNIKRLIQGTESQIRDSIIMQQLTKSLHLLAVGLWFGMAIFLTFVAAPSLFNTFETLAQQDPPPENWFPRPVLFAGDKTDLVDPVKEQGTRAAGHAVGPMFVWYFLIQGVCGFIALATAYPFLKLPGRSHQWRFYLLIAAIALVLVGWKLERTVHDLREPRNQLTEIYLKERTQEAEMNARDARTAFGLWHLGSLAANFATILCVTAVMAMTGNLAHAASVEDERKDPAGL